MLKTLGGIIDRLQGLKLPNKERIVVELRTKSGEVKNGYVIAITKPAGTSTVVIFAEE